MDNSRLKNNVSSILKLFLTGEKELYKIIDPWNDPNPIDFFLYDNEEIDILNEYGKNHLGKKYFKFDIEEMRKLVEHIPDHIRNIEFSREFIRQYDLSKV